jgi:hypothetical protein
VIGEVSGYEIIEGALKHDAERHGFFFIPVFVQEK